MAIKCPKCQFENPADTDYCSMCATPLKPLNEIAISHTKTLQVPMKKLIVGSTFAGRYQILEELGKGGMGEVYRVKDETLDEEMALKVLKPEIAADKDIIERFKNELKFARRIAHRNVCKMYDLNEEKETPYITMEYVKGEDLKSFIRRKERLKEEEVIALAKQVCEGLAEAHALGVVHRDLKPQNIMIDEKINAKVMDFGIARSVEAPGVTQTGVMIGTPDYISPEQAEGEEADQRSDIYSLGVILYEMVTGSVPFKGDTAFSVALKHKTKLPQDPKKLNPEVSDDLCRMILICMEKDRERRYQRIQDLLSDLRNIAEGLPLGTKIRPRRETFAAALIRKKLFIPALVVALAIITVAIWQLLPQKETAPSSPSGKPSLAVLYFENNTGDESLDHWRKALSELLIADLLQSKYLEVLPGDRLFKILEDLNQLEAISYSSDVLREVAVRGRVENILRGNYIKAGDTFRINIMLQSARTGELIGSEKVEGIGEESFFAMVDELTPKIKVNFKLTNEEIAGDSDKDVGKITTSSPEALKYYIDAGKYHGMGDYNQAIQLAKKAVAIDPEFAMAYLSISTNYYNLNHYSEHKKYLKKALELKDRVSERERYSIMGSFYWLSEETYDKAIEVYNKLVELYPEEKEPYINLAIIYSYLEEWEKSIERFEVLRKEDAKSIFIYSNLAIAYWYLYNYKKAEEVLKYYINNFSDDVILNGLLAYNYLFQGDYNRAIQEVDKAISLNPTIYRNLYIKGDIYHIKGDLSQAEREYKKLIETGEKAAQLDARDKLGALYLLQGKFDKSEDQMRQGIKLAEELGEHSDKSTFQLKLAYLYIKMRKLKEALEECNKAWRGAVESEDLGLQRNVLHHKGLTYLAMKSLSEAQRTTDELKELSQKVLNRKVMRNYHHLMGMKEFKRNNFSKSIKELRKAISFVSLQHTISALFIDSLALAYYKAEDLEKAREEYERILSLIYGRLYYGDIYAKSFYMLGKIYEQQGNTSKAKVQYERFLDLWKDADPGIAEVADAREKVAELGK